ncbi:ROK family protein [Bosea sp. ANAM02]|uniref:ROK family protein n=1 Tax=Bosea sp. ANAM02 TaxID=2020412 RepID=UPI00140EC9BD|nr:ROK family protein [Bosea sp. ANAM02]BCB17559.1 ArsR family transcriptional regulator [Bosea sp. ANAM02]
MSLLTLDETRLALAHDRDCARIYRLVLNGEAHSRADIGRILQLRSTSVSRVVADLIARRLVIEAVGEASGRGRPPAILVAHTRRIGASVIYVSSQSLSGALVDLNGHLVAERRRPIAGDADNAAIAAAMAELAHDLLDAMPPGMSHAGTAVSLSGLIDLKQGQWLLASRWPRMRGLDIASVLEPVAGPVTISRNLDAELRARAARDPESFAGGTILLHWGWGVGLAYAVDGEPFAPTGSFGEIGHWRLAALNGRRCGCGNTACLETGAALWALLPALRRHWPDLDQDEVRLARQLAGLDLLSLPEMETAVELLARALANACRMLFPARIAVSGPFSANPQLWARFNTLFRAEGTMDGFAVPDLAGAPASHLYEIHGAAAPLLSRATEALLLEQA